DVFPYGTIELENEAGGSTFKVNGNRVKLCHEQHLDKEAEVYLLKDASDHRGTIKDHLVKNNSKWKVACATHSVVHATTTLAARLVVLALAAPKPILPSVTPVQKDPETSISEMPRVPKMRRTARISVKPVWHQFSEGVIAKGGPSTAATKEKVVTNDSSDNEISKKMEDDNMELIAMDEPFVPVEEDEEEEEEGDLEEDPDEEEEEGKIEYFCDEEDYEDYFSAEDDDSFDGSTGSN
ncbi:hypothetical protein PIB30_085528, partial [Stylosanthes scabra]|nr:hypothetical protein [Stylosanthes scabra]